MSYAIMKYAVAVSVFVTSTMVHAEIVTFGSGSNQFSMELVPIGNPGNAPDTTGNPNPAGSVGYNYRIGKYEVSEDMITKYNANFGTANGLAVMTDRSQGPNKPANVKWNEAARFVNWLNTSSGSFPAYKFTTSGVSDNIALWTPADTLDYNPANPFRSLRANYVITNTNEWYKAAYYDPISATYFDYPTGSNDIPMSVPSGTAANTAVYVGPWTDLLNVTFADITNAGGLSPYGTMAQGGNAFEWEETEFDLLNDDPSSNRGVRGGYAGFVYNHMAKSRRDSHNLTPFSASLGFRVASLSQAIPEPSSLLMAGLGTCMLSVARRQRSKNS